MGNLISQWLEAKIELIAGPLIQAEVEVEVAGITSVMTKAASKEAAETISDELKKMQKRLRSQLKYWFDQKITAPDILVQDSLLPAIGADYTLLDLNSNEKPLIFGGNLNLVELKGGDVIVIACVFTDHKGKEARLFQQELQGPLPDPFYVIEPIVVTSGVKVLFRATQGHPRSFTYSFYRWK